MARRVFCITADAVLASVLVSVLSACSPGQWGLNCNRSCSSHCSPVHRCDFHNGYCTCQTGYQLPRCDTASLSELNNAQSSGISAEAVGYIVAFVLIGLLIIGALAYCLMVKRKKSKAEKTPESKSSESTSETGIGTGTKAPAGGKAVAVPTYQVLHGASIKLADLVEDHKVKDTIDVDIDGSDDEDEV